MNKDKKIVFPLLYILRAVIAQSIQRLGYGLDDRGSITGRSNDEIFSSLPSSPDRLWSPPSLLSNEYQGLFPWE
jgi:hypothetical protein